MAGGAIASVLLHGGLIAAFFVLHAAPPPQGAPIYSVRLIAGPAAPVTTIDAAPPAAKPAPIEKAAAAPPKPPKKSVPAKKAKATPAAPAIASQTAPPKASAAAPAATETPASALSTGGKGADVANVSTGGVEFP